MRASAEGVTSSAVNGAVFSDALRAAWGDRGIPALPQGAAKDGWAMPPALLVMSSTHWWEGMGQGDRRACAAAQAVQAIFLGRYFEAALIQRLVRESMRACRSDARVLLQEAIEECQHSIWFDEVLATYPDVRPRISRRFAVATGLTPKSGMKTTSWLAVLLGELLIDELNRATAGDPSCGGRVKDLSAAHSADEALHVRTASSAVLELRVSPAARAAVRVSVYVLLREVLQPAVPKRLIERHGHPPAVRLGQVEAVRELVVRALRRLGRSAGDVEWGLALGRRAETMRLGGRTRTTVV